MWEVDFINELTHERILQEVGPHFPEKHLLIRRIYSFLERYGYINFGRFFSTETVPREKKGAIVIGGGAAGLAAAKQLHHFGFHVILLEGRDRIGGRVRTVQVKNGEGDTMPVDVGAALMSCIPTNPLLTLQRQTACIAVLLNTSCPLYDVDGTMVDDKKMESFPETFHELGRMVEYLIGVKTLKKWHKEHNRRKQDHIEDEEPISLGQAVDIVINHKESYTAETNKDSWKEHYDALIAETVRIQWEMLKKMWKLKQVVSMKKKIKEAGEKAETQQIAAELNILVHQVDEKDINKELNELKEKYKGLMAIREKLNEAEPKDETLLEPIDKRILEYYRARRELEKGTTLENLDGWHWTGYEEHWTKNHFNLALQDGFQPLLERVAAFNGIEDPFEVIKLNHAVTDVFYDEKGVTVRYILGEDKQHTREITSDCVVCTVPLGVLKKDAIRFDPPLPKAKRDVIRDMGFGNVNKVVLVFDKPFWDLKQNFFGHLNEMSQQRGENFLFMSDRDLPILTTFMSGKAAEMKESAEVIITKAMGVLRAIFGEIKCPKMPVQAAITYFQSDKYAFGTTSHIPPGFTGKIYDEMAEAVRARAEDGSCSGTPRIFFAGEHTSQADPDTVQGAWLSGIRAAAEVANEFLGTPFAAKNRKDVECVDVVDDDEGDFQVLEEVMNTWLSDDEFIPDEPGPSQPGPSSQPTVGPSMSDGAVQRQKE